MIKANGKYLITGGSGFLGKEMIARLHSLGVTDISVVSRSQSNLILLKQKFPFIEIIPGDISDPVTVAKACQGVTGIFHFAAFKYVSMSETHSWECIRSNVLGTMNMLARSIEQCPDFFVFVSSDKAMNAKGVYGSSKLLGEKLTQEASRINHKTHYSIVRYGNVWASTGSFVTIWEPIIKSGQQVILNEPNATRFFFKVGEAVETILNSFYGKSGDVTVPKMKGISMGLLLECCQEVWGQCPVKIIGLQPGENMHETIDGIHFSNEMEKYLKEEFIKEFLSE